MEPIRPSIPVVNAPTAPARLKLTLAQYRAMGEHGILPPRLRVELIEGEIIEMAPMSWSTSSAAIVEGRIRLSANARSSATAGFR